MPTEIVSATQSVNAEKVVTKLSPKSMKSSSHGENGKSSSPNGNHHHGTTNGSSKHHSPRRNSGSGNSSSSSPTNSEGQRRGSSPKSESSPPKAVEPTTTATEVAGVVPSKVEPLASTPPKSEGATSSTTNGAPAATATAAPTTAKAEATSPNKGEAALTSAKPTAEEATPSLSVNAVTGEENASASSNGESKRGLSASEMSTEQSGGYAAASPLAQVAAAVPDGVVTKTSSLINLEVKVLTQSLGAENQWLERGDGIVEFRDFTIRVVALSPSPPNGTQTTPSSPKQPGKLSPPVKPLTDLSDLDEAVILEDTINSDTPFVGENCCIVWNSFEQQLSLCLMYASEEGYSASWSALVALQDKAYPPIRFDLLQRCHAPPPLPEDASPEEKAAAKEASRAPLLPYSCIIHDKYVPPLGFIEQHAISLSLMENQHLTNPALYEDKDTVISLISLANADVLEQLLTPEVFPLLLAGGLARTADSAKTVISGGAKAAMWEVPESLTNLTVPEELTKLILKDLRLNYLREEVLKPSHTRTEVLMKLTTISHRIRNELTCALLSSDVTLQQARDALMVLPATPTQEAPSRAARPDSSIASLASENASSMRCSTPNANESTSPTAPSEAAKIEQQVIQHLHFFRSLVALSLSELGRDLVGPVIVKVFQCGLLEALSLVAERFGMPSGSAASFLNYLTNEHGEKPPRVTTPNAYSPAVAHELTLLLDITLVRLNERQEEQLMNDIVRAPILAEPVKYNGLVTFVLRQLLVGGLSNYKQVLRDYNGVRNPFVLYHILGLHDDEGSAAAERALDPESTNLRNRFHHFIITKYLMHASRGLVAPVPQPPSSSSKSAPIVQFNNSAPSGANTNVLQQLPQGISPHFVRMLEYLVLLTNTENRELLLKMIFNNKSHVLQFLDCTFNLAIKSRAIGLDILAGNIRFLKMIISQLSLRTMGMDESPLGVFTSPAEPLPKPLVTQICRQLTVERDTFESILKAYVRIGGRRQYTVFHSSVNALLDMISKAPLDTDEPGQNSLRDVRDYVFLKYQDLLPERFRVRFKQSLLEELCLRLGKDINSSANQSVSVLSSTASEVMRSSTKLRFVDEVEAATGGVDGSVPATASGLNPTVVNSVAHEEMNRKRNNQHMQAAVEQWSPSHATKLTANEVRSPSRSPPPTGTVERKNSGSFTLETPPKAGSAPPAQPTEKSGAVPALKPTAPKAERPAAHRPRSLSALEQQAEKTSTETVLPTANRSSTPPGEPEVRVNMPQHDPLVLPKIKKRTGSGSGSPTNVNSGNSSKSGKS